jgi:uncharacterized protein YcbK (DUF882 family)
VDYLEPLRARYGPVTIISGYRTRRYNESVNGAPQSFHIYLLSRYGVAADIWCREGSARAWYRFLDGLKPGGLGAYTGHVHVDNRTGAPARW